MGTYLKPSIIAREALIVLENNLVLANLVHKDYSNEFQAGVGGTVAIRVPATFTSGTVASTVNTQTVTESSVTVCLDTQLDITIDVTDREMTMDIVSFSEQIVQPIMRAHAQAIDYQIAKLYSGIANYYPVTSGTALLSDLAQLRAVMNINKVPLTDRRLVLAPASEAKYLSIDAIAHASKHGDGGRALREAEIGRVMGFDTYLDQNINTHTYGGAALTDVAGAASAATIGATQMVIYNLGTAQTLAAGEVFKPTGSNQWFTMTAASTLAGGIATVQVAPAVSVAITDATVVTFQATHYANMAFHKNAIALVTRPLAPPIGGADCEVINYNGMSCRVVYDYVMMTKTSKLSIDLLLGTKLLDKTLAARLCDAV